MTFHMASEVDLDLSEVEFLDSSKPSFVLSEAIKFDSSMADCFFVKSIADCSPKACCFVAAGIDFDDSSRV